MRVLLLDTNVSSYPIFEQLQKNHEVYVAGKNPNDCLALCCKNYLKIDYSSLEQVEKAVDNYKIDVVLPGCNDVSYQIACLYANKHESPINIDSPEVNDIINKKDKFKAFAFLIGLKVPNQIKRSELINHRYPKVVIKPTDAFSGNGVTVLDSKNFHKLDKAIDVAIKYSKSNEFLIEEFIDGQLYSHSAFIENGIIKNDFIVEEHCLTNPFAVDTSWVISNEDFQLYTDIRSEINLLIRKLKLCDGLVHTQFMVYENELRIIEVTRRCPGDLYSKLIEYSTGFSYSQRFITLILKESSNQSNVLLRRKVLRHTLTYKSQKHFISLKFNKKVDFFEFVPLSFAGMLLNHAPKGRAGILFLNCSTDEELQQLKEDISNTELLIN